MLQGEIEHTEKEKLDFTICMYIYIFLEGKHGEGMQAILVMGLGPCKRGNFESRVNQTKSPL